MNIENSVLHRLFFHLDPRNWFVATFSRRDILQRGVVVTTLFSGCFDLAREEGHEVIPTRLEALKARQPSGDPVTVANDGETSHVVVVEADAPRPVVFAGHELADYLGRVTGARFPVARATPDSSRGVLRVTTTDEDPRDIRAADSFGVLIQDGDVLLLGGSQRATLYAVYDFLERHIGCHWAAPGSDGEFVPKQKNITLDPTAAVHSPDVAYRIAGEFQSERYVDWATKRKLHVARWLRDTDDIPTYLERRGGPVEAVDAHSFDTVLPPDEYRRTHPEFYGEDDADQLNVTKSDVADAVVHRARRFFDDNPDATFFPITPNDGYGWPESTSPERHLKAQARDGRPRRFMHHPIVSDAYFGFVSEVARRLRRTHPDRRVYCLAYINYVFPPATISELPSNVVVSVAHYRPADYATPVGQDASHPNRRFASILRDWLDVADKLWMYSYTVKYALDNLPFPVAYNVAATIDYITDLGYEGFYSQGDEGRWGQCGPHFYVMAKHLWNTDNDVSRLLDDYFAATMGPAASTARAVYDELAARLRSAGVQLNRKPMEEMRPILTPSVLKAADRRLAGAVATATDPRHRRNLEAMLAPIRYAPLYYAFRGAVDDYRESGDPDDAERVASTFRSIKRLVERYDHIDALPRSIVADNGYFTLRRYLKGLDIDLALSDDG